MKQNLVHATQTGALYNPYINPARRPVRPNVNQRVSFGGIKGPAGNNQAGNATPGGIPLTQKDEDMVITPGNSYLRGLRAQEEDTMISFRLPEAQDDSSLSS